jgi:hypothetical protein
MPSRLLVAGAALVAALLALGAAPAGAKEGVVARVQTPISRDADPGTRITVVWMLYSVEAGERRPFGGGAIFIRLLGPGDSRSKRVYAAPIEPGRYRATVRVPRGGVRRLELGIMGMVCNVQGRLGCRPSPKLFPIVGSPFR